MEAARPLELHACVKVQHNAAAVGEEVHVGEARQGLEDAGLLLSYARTAAARPLPLECPHDAVGDEGRTQHCRQVARREEVGEAVALVAAAVILILLVYCHAGELEPGCVDALKHHAGEETA